MEGKMPSPFPGMDPYIESKRIWSDFHHGLASEIRARINAYIQSKYYAAIVTSRAYDVIEVIPTKPRSTPFGSVTTALIDPPQAQSIALLEVAVRLANVEVREAGTDTLVTAIEILSPINKRPGREREKYLRKRRELLRSEVHVMELDLLRAGERSPLETPLPAATYYVTLARADYRPYVDGWPIQLEARLPVLPVPLRTPDPDVPLDLGAIVQAVYERGGYATRIDYRQPIPLPPLAPTQQAYVEKLLMARR